MFSASNEVDQSILNRLLDGEVPQEWQSTSNFINSCDMTKMWQWKLLECFAKKVTETRPGVDKKENKDFYIFNMDPKFELSKSLQESGWKQYNCTIRLGQLEGQKAKRTHYTFHFWAQPSPSGIDYSQIILLKLKLEGKFIPSTQEEQQMVINLANQLLD